MYKLLDLSYLYQDLEPYIDIHTMGLHYNKHAKNYLNKLNELLKKNNYDYRYELNELLYHINEFKEEDREDILFNLGGVLNHDLYFKSMHPIRKEKPNNYLEKYLNSKYGSYDKFWETFKNKALKLKGSGYTFLILKSTGELDIINTHNQESPLSHGYLPLFNIDMWEHAYYLNYENDKAKYIDNFKEIADFSYANKIYNKFVK